MKEVIVFAVILIYYSNLIGQEDSLFSNKSTQKVVVEKIIDQIVIKGFAKQPTAIFHNVEKDFDIQKISILFHDVEKVSGIETISAYHALEIVSDIQTSSIIYDNQKENGQKAVNADGSEEINNRKRLKGPTLFDSRIEIRDLNQNIFNQYAILENSKSVAIIVEKNLLSKVSDSISYLDLTSKLGDLYTLCEKEAFRNQPVAGVGTAFISGDQSLTSASHVFSGPLSNYAVIFGFQIINNVGAYASFFESRNIFYPTEVINKSEELDVIIFKVDRPLERTILQPNETSIIKDTEVYMIGYPMGIPQKVAVNARVYDIDHPEYFYTTLDAFQGNSGSPVFNANTHKVIGVLVSGELDYRWNGQCNESTLCKLPYCKGEKVIRMDRITREFD